MNNNHFSHSDETWRPNIIDKNSEATTRTRVPCRPTNWWYRSMRSSSGEGGRTGGFKRSAKERLPNKITKNKAMKTTASSIWVMSILLQDPAKPRWSKNR